MFIELTHPKGDRLFVRIEAIAGFSKGRESASEIDLGQGAAYHVCETPAEIAALIAAKEREAAITRDAFAILRAMKFGAMRRDVTEPFADCAEYALGQARFFHEIKAEFFAAEAKARNGGA